jgi:hypothetical protein
MPTTRHAPAPPAPAILRRALLGSALLLPASAALAQGRSEVVRLTEQQFRPGAGRITFREVPRGTRNPVYTPQMYGGRAGDPTVSFGGHLLGRTVGRPGQCPPGAVPSGCLVGVARGPVALDPAAPPAVTTNNGSDRHVQLSGTPVWNGPMAMVLSRDVAAVGLVGGLFDATRATALTVYDRQGRVIGRTENHALRLEFIALATADLSPRIAAMEFHIIGAEPAGFGIENIRFGAPEQVDVPGVRPPPPAPPPAPPAAPPPPARLAPLLL